MPALAIYSRDDGVVGWGSCRDPATEWVEVRSSHHRVGIDPEVYQAMDIRLRRWAGARSDAPGAAERALAGRRARVEHQEPLGEPAVGPARGARLPLAPPAHQSVSRSMCAVWLTCSRSAAILSSMVSVTST